MSSNQRVVQANGELGPEDVCVPIREVSSFQRVLCYVQASMELSWGLKMCPY